MFLLKTEHVLSLNDKSDTKERNKKVTISFSIKSYTLIDASLPREIQAWEENEIKRWGS